LQTKALLSARHAQMQCAANGEVEKMKNRILKQDFVHFLVCFHRVQTLCTGGFVIKIHLLKLLQMYNIFMTNNNFFYEKNDSGRFFENRRV
jgi:hypothetical protein